MVDREPFIFTGNDGRERRGRWGGGEGIQIFQCRRGSGQKTENH